MKMAKRWIAILCVLTVIMGCLAGCGQKQEETTTTKAPETTTAAPDKQDDDKEDTTGGSEGSGKWEWGDITFVVPFKAGGGADTVARLLAEYWGKEIGANFVVDNRKGANTEIGNTYYIKETPKDCTALLMGVEIYYASCIQAQNADYKF
ncbi:MAG: hypothetical protein II930_02620, partial [Lachnospiraceae bacterium]|nr:hypothetical protein [Lachnospiraceae bacterium]